MGRRANLGAVGGGQGGRHLGDGQASDRVGPVGGHVTKWDKHKGAVLQAGVWQDQLVGGKVTLVVRRQVTPAAVGDGVGQDRLAKGDEIEVERSHPPAGFAAATKVLFNVMQQSENLFGAKSGGHGCGDGGVHIIGTGPCRKTRGRIYPAGGQGSEMCSQIGTSEAQGFVGCQSIMREVGAESDEQTLAGVVQRVTLSYSRT